MRKKSSFQAALFYVSVFLGIGLFTVPANSARTILTDVARPGHKEKVRRFVISGVTDARCQISARNLESPAAKREMAECRQRLMTHTSVIQVGAALANAVEESLRQTAASESAVKSEVAKRLTVFDSCVRGAIDMRQTLPLEGLAQLCAVSKSGSPTEGMKSLVIKEKDTIIVVYDFDAAIFDSLIEQEDGKPAPWARSSSATAKSCEEKTCNRCRAVGYSSNYVQVSYGEIAKAFPEGAFSDGNKKILAKIALKKDFVDQVSTSLKEISSDLRLDDFWYVKDKKLGAFLCMTCPQGYVSNGLNGCFRDGCELGEWSCRQNCASHELLSGNPATCVASCEVINIGNRSAIDGKRAMVVAGSKPEVPDKRITEYLLSRVKENEALCKKDPKRLVFDPSDLHRLSEGAKVCKLGQVMTDSGCKTPCFASTAFTGSLDFGHCPLWFVRNVILRISEQRGRTCNIPITTQDVRDYIAESGFNCAVYAPMVGKGRTDPGPKDALTVDE